MQELKRRLGLFDAILLVSGSMIGSGIFIVSAGMARNLGGAGWLLLAWVVAGILTVLAALAYGELSGMMPNAGGQYVYIRRAFGPLPSFLYGWTVFTVIQTGVIAAVAMAFAKFMAVFFPVFGPGNTVADLGFLRIHMGQVLAVGSILFLTWTNSQGVKNGKWMQILFTTAKMAALAGLIALGIGSGWGKGIWEANWAHAWTAGKALEQGGFEALSGWALVSAMGLAMVGSLFSSDAWNNVTFIAGEIRNPSRNLPLSLFLGTLVVTGLYLLANVAYLFVLPLHDIQNAAEDRVGTAAASAILGEAGVGLMALLIIISTFGCNNGLILAGSRLFYAMAEGGYFFRRAAVLNKHEVPGAALWMQCAWASVLCLSGKYGDLLEYTTFASLLFYVVTLAGLFRLRQTEPETPRPYRAWGYPVLPALYIFFAIAFCLNLLLVSPGYSLAGLGIVALGIPVYIIRKGLQAKGSE